jgi:hypothetical protein
MKTTAEEDEYSFPHVVLLSGYLQSLSYLDLYYAVPYRFYDLSTPCNQLLFLPLVMDCGGIQS